jgi:hypothetical protein
MQRVFSAFALGLFLGTIVLLSGCGGGGGDKKAAPPPNAAEIEKSGGIPPNPNLPAGKK